MGTEYTISWLAKFLHGFPHLDLTFQSLNSTFDPMEPRYREALVFWAALPVLWLLVTLLLFLVYFCYRCCQREVEKKQRVPCLKWSMAILALITCGAVGIGFYGNEETNKGNLQFASAAEDAADTVQQMKDQSILLKFNINTTVENGLLGMEKLVYDEQDNLRTKVKNELRLATDTVRRDARRIFTNIVRINNKARKVYLQKMIDYVRDYGFYRWLGMLLLLSWMIILCLMLLLGVGNSSKCTLLMFCAFGIFTLVLCWMSAGLHLGLSVGLGDFCTAPDHFFERLGSEKIEKDIVNYYIKCEPKKAPNPFRDALQSASDNIRNTNNSLAIAVKEFSNHFPIDEFDTNLISENAKKVAKGLDGSVVNVMKLTALVECRNLHKDYIDGVEGLCYSALPGVVFMLLSAIITGLLFTILVLMASKAWRHFSKREKYPGEYVYNAEEAVPLQNVDDGSVTHYRKGYLEIDDEDTFLPRPDNSSPSYISFTRGRPGNQAREHVPMQRRSTPPPAYNSYNRGMGAAGTVGPPGGDEFYRHYDMNHLADDHSDVGRESIA